MIQKMYAVRDTATDQFGSIMLLINNGHAARSFTDQVNENDKNNPLYNHSEDYELYYLGDYNTDTGKIQTTNEPEMIIRGKDVRK